jgi:hypothetical protein
LRERRRDKRLKERSQDGDTGGHRLSR